MNENINEDEIFEDSESKVAMPSFRNTRKLSIFGKSSSDRRTTDSHFTLSSKIDENLEYEKKRNKEIEKWFKLVSQAKEQYLHIKSVDPTMNIEDLPENYRNFLRDQISFVNSHVSSTLDEKFQATFLEFITFVKNIEAMKSLAHDNIKLLLEQKSANAEDKLFFN
ncbi:hypothetical protein ACFFRR_008157 [Megaselia abdita]